METFSAAEAGAPRLRVPLLPAGATTGIGSLPFTNIAKALAAVVTLSREVPFWPQLPRLSSRESIIGQGLSALHGLILPRASGYGYDVRSGRLDAVLETLRGGNGELTSANAAGFFAFEEACAQALFSSADAIKGQVEGPITLATYLFHNNRPFLSDPALFSALTVHISQAACWQVERLARFGKPVLIFVDEPALCIDLNGSVSEDSRLNGLTNVFAAVRNSGAAVGLHCCAARPFDRMCEANPDVISFDAHQYLEAFLDHESVRHFLREGGCAAYGLIPTWRSLDSVDPNALFQRWRKAAVSGQGDERQLARQSMVTATCGLGLVDEVCVAASFNLASRVGGLLRALADAE
jgi:hypothetical protein